MNNIDIIKFSDDYHDEIVWIDGMLAGRENETRNLIETSFDVFKEYKDAEEIEINTIRVDIYDYDSLEKDEQEKITEWFNDCLYIKEDELDCIKNQNWEKLYKIINNNEVIDG